MHGALQDPDKFIEQADQEQQELRRRLEGATQRVRTIQACPLLPYCRLCPLTSHEAAVCLACASCGNPMTCSRPTKHAAA